VYGYPPDWLLPDGYDALTTYLMSAAGSSLPAASARALNVTLQKEVVEIDYSTAGRCKVTCRDGSVYNADACVSTIPSGVMKRAPSTLFKPALPQYKRDSLTRLRVGDDGGPDKMFLLYANKWWANQGVSTFWGFDAGITSKSRGNWSYFVDFSGVTNRSVLLAFTLGRYSTSFLLSKHLNGLLRF
jgi:monoamine oxidase